MAFARLGAGAGGTGTTSATWNSFNITASDANTVAVVLVNCSVSSNTAGTTCAVTYGGTAMKQLGWVASGATTERAGVGIFYLFNPGTGAKSIVATPTTGTIAQTQGIDVAFSGVSSIGAAQNVTTMAHTVNSVAGGYALRVLSNGVTAGTLSHTTELAAGAVVGGAGDFIAVQSAAGAATVAFTASGAATTPLSMGCTVNAVGQINFVQSAVSTNVPGVSATALLTGPCFVGDVIVAAFKINETTGITVSSVTDTVGNTYSLVNPGTVVTGGGTVWMYCAPVTYAADAGVNTVTATMSSSATNIELTVGEYDGVDPTPLDQHIVGTGTGTAMISGNFYTYFPAEVIVAYGYASTSVAAAGAGFTARVIGGGSGACLEDQVVSSAGLNSATATSNTGNWALSTASFIGIGQIKPAPAPPLQIPNRYVGPMALRSAYRRAQPWSQQITGLSSDSTSTDTTVGLTATGVVGISVDAVSTDTTVGLTSDGSVDAGQPAPAPDIPNRYVGPMALRARFRRATPWGLGPDSFSSDSVSTDTTVGLTADGVVGTVSTATTAVTVGLTADGIVGVNSTVTTAITVGLTATGVVGTVSSATTAVTVGLTADGVIGVVGVATSTDTTVGLTADGASDGLQPAPPLLIANRYVGPMALRAAFRRAQSWASGPPPVQNDYTGDATSTAITVGLTADGVVGTLSSATTAITVGLTATGVVGIVAAATSTDITVGLTADGVVGVVGVATSTDVTVGLSVSGSMDELHPAPPLIIANRYVGPMALRAAFRRAQPWGIGPDAFSADAASTDTTVGLTATGVVGTVTSATSTDITVGLTATSTVGTASTATTAVTVGLTASGIVGTVSSATTTVTVGLTADGVIGVVGQADSAITVGLNADGVNPDNIPPAAAPGIVIPNRYVGPMALRAAFRRAQQWLNQLTGLISDAQSTDTTVALTATGVVGTSSTVATTITAGLTATGVVGVVGQASTAITVGLTATGGGAASSTATTAITVGLTATGVVGTASTTTTSTTVGLTATGVVGTLSQTTTTVTVGQTATGFVGVASTATTSITVGLTADGFLITSALASTASTAVVIGLTATGVIQIFTSPAHTVTADARTRGVTGDADASARGGGIADATTRETSN